MRLLTTNFPQLQFIATTNSPLVASGCEGIPVHRLNQGQHTIEHPFGWLAEDVYRMMDVPTSRAESFDQEVLEDFKRLDAKRVRGKITHADKTRQRSLRRQR